MSSPFRRSRVRRAAIALVAGLIFAVVPAAAQAAPVDLATVSPFVVLGGATVTNTGPSVLNGDLGVSPGTALVGFGLPAVVNGATHANNAVAAQAQSDLTTAYDVAAGQPVAPANDLTGTNLGNRTLTAGAYRFTSSAQLTGRLTLNAQGDPNAQFVFKIASALTTASASSVALTNGASACNVYWQVGSSATLGTTTAFQGNLMALTSISLNNGATVIGRMLARNGQVSLINNVLSAPQCGTGSAGSGPTPRGPGAGSRSPGSRSRTPGSRTGSPGSRNGSPTADRPRLAGRNGSAALRRAPGSATTRRTPGVACTDGFRATVRGHLIWRVVFKLDGRQVSSQRSSPFRVSVDAVPGRHVVSARISFRDATRAMTRTLRYRACAAAVLQPRPGPSVFTG
ncbi:MAG TPA: ice-binding family protein [Conexibacter sp.]|nr:ice-binding family protein [Conexibacter sp.]